MPKLNDIQIKQGDIIQHVIGNTQIGMKKIEIPRNTLNVVEWNLLPRMEVIVEQSNQPIQAQRFEL